MELGLPSPPTGGRTPQAEEGEYPQVVQGAFSNDSAEPTPDPSGGWMEDRGPEEEETRRDLGQPVAEEGGEAT